MRKLKIAYLLAFAPVLMGSDYEARTSELIATSVPVCTGTQVLQYNSDASTLVCATVGGAGLAVPDCKTSGQLLTFTQNGEVGSYSCTPKGSEALSAGDVAQITTTYNTLVSFDTLIKNIETGTKAPAAVYCGNTSTVAATGGAQHGGFVDQTNTGLAAANSLCAKVTACGTGSRMCSTFDMYQSVATGKLTTATAVNQGWVFMEAYANGGNGYDPGGGLNDNCGNYTYSTGDRTWQGMTASWNYASGVAGPFALQFSKVACSANGLGILCCK